MDTWERAMNGCVLCRTSRKRRHGVRVVGEDGVEQHVHEHEHAVYSGELVVLVDGRAGHRGYVGGGNFYLVSILSHNEHLISYEQLH